MDVTSDTVMPAILTPRACARRPKVFARISVHSSAWMLSLAVHGLLVVALSYCYFKDFSTKACIDDSAVLAVQFQPAEPEPVIEEVVREEPLPPIVIESMEALADQQPLPPPDLPPILLEVVAPEVEDAVKPEREHLADATSAAHFAAMKFKKPPVRIPEPATATDAGGSHAGSGAAPALIAVASSSPKAIPVANGVNGSGPGSGVGRGSGEGTNLGNGTPAGDGKGYGTGHGDGIGSGRGAGRGGGSVDKPPRIDRLERPDYPRDALRSGIEGTVKCLVQVLASGKVGDVSVYQSSGYADLDRAACDALKHSRFFPAEADGKAVNFELVVPYVYKIRQR